METRAKLIDAYLTALSDAVLTPGKPIADRPQRHGTRGTKALRRSRAIEILADEILADLARPRREARGLLRLAAERQAAARDRRVRAFHDTEVCDGARSLGMGQRQRKPGLAGQLPAPRGNAHALLVPARGQGEQHQSCHCEHSRHLELFTRHSPDCLMSERKVPPFRLSRQGRSEATSWRWSRGT